MHGSGALLSSIFDAVPDAILGIRERDISFANHAVAAVFGWKIEELVGRSTRVLYRSDEEYEEIGRQFYPVLESQRTFDALFPCRHRSGKDIMCHVRVSRIGEDLQDKMIVATYRDVTEQWETDNRLKKTNEKLDRQVKACKSGLREAHARVETEIEKNRADGEKLQRLEEQQTLILNTAFETTCRDYDGNSHCLDYSSKPIRDAQGHVLMVLAEGRDITDRHEMEEIVRESEKNYRTIFDAVNDGIFIHDLKTGEILDVNLKALEIFGYRSKVEVQGMTVEAFSTNEPPYTAENALNFIHKAASEGPQLFSWQVKTRNGQTVWVEVSLKKASLKKRDCILAVVRDVTKRKRGEEEKRRLETQIQQTLKMEAIGTLSGGIAHDFNNLLMGIQGYTSLMLMSAEPGQSCYERLKSIEQQVLTGADLTKQLLGFARRGRYEVKTTDLNDLVRRTAEMFGRTKKDIHIHEKYEEILWPVDVDPGQIEQALLNLFVNAWQAMPGGGTLSLETQNAILEEDYVKPHEIHGGAYVKLSVTDTGVGMDKQTCLRIFEPFFTTKEMSRGTGLGLAYTYGIIRGHGGMINVYSERGHGTTFNIYLPASGPAVSPGVKLRAELREGQETILLVDDENIIVEVTQEILEELGYRVLIARNGEEAVEIYGRDKGKIDLVILDMIMPGIGGGEVYDRLKEMNPGVKVILSSGYSINGEAMDILDRGVRVFLQKPFTATELSGRIREVLDEK